MININEICKRSSFLLTLLLGIFWVACSSGSEHDSQLSGGSLKAIGETDTLPAEGKKEFFGLHYDFIWGLDGERNTIARSRDMANLVNRLEELGVGSVRLPIRWEALLRKDRSTNCASLLDDYYFKAWNLDYYARIIKAIPDDIDILMYLDSPPEQCERLFTWNPAGFAQRYADYITRVITELQEDPELKNRVRNFEVWNEPNNNEFYLAPPYGADACVHWSGWSFVDHILQPGYAAIKSFSNSEYSPQVILGGMVGNGVDNHFSGPKAKPKMWGTVSQCKLDATCDPPGNTNSCNRYSIPDFLGEVYEASNGLPPHGDGPPYFDVVATHPYADDEDVANDIEPHVKTFEDTKSTRQVMVARNDPGTPIWWTEIGYMHEVGSPNIQATTLQAWLENAWGHREDPETPLERFFWFQLRDPNSDPSYGLLEDTSKRREAFFAYKQFIMGKNAHASLIDDFSSQDFPDYRPIDTVMWGITTAGNGGGFLNGWKQQAIHINPGNYAWGRYGIYTKHPIPVSDGDTVRINFKVNNYGGGNASPDNMYSLISIGPKESIDSNEKMLLSDPSNGIHLMFRRHYVGLDSNLKEISRLAMELVSVNKEVSDEKNKLIEWTTVWDSNNPTNCSWESTGWNWMATVRLILGTDGTWSLKVMNSTGTVCMNRSGNNNTADLTSGGTLGGRFAAVTADEAGTGFVKYDNITITTKELPTAYSIDL